MVEKNFDDPDLLASIGPAITQEQVESMEAAATTQARGIQRRICLIACAKSAEELRKISIESPGAFEDMFNSIEAFKAHSEGLVAVASAAQMRMAAAYSGEAQAVV